MRLTYETTINAPQGKVWEVLNDWGNVARFHPLVLESHSLNDIPGGRGAERRCDFGKGVALYERIVDATDGNSIDVDIYQIEGMPSVVRSMQAHFDLSTVPAGTRVVGTIEVTITPKVAAALMGPILKRQLRKGWLQLLAGMKRHVETSELINLESALDTAAVTPVTTQ